METKQAGSKIERAKKLAEIDKREHSGERDVQRRIRCWRGRGRQRWE